MRRRSIFQTQTAAAVRPCLRPLPIAHNQSYAKLSSVQNGSQSTLNQLQAEPLPIGAHFAVKRYACTLRTFTIIFKTSSILYYILLLLHALNCPQLRRFVIHFYSIMIYTNCLLTGRIFATSQSLYRNQNVLSRSCSTVPIAIQSSIV